MWSTWVRSCHPTPPFENSSLQRRMSLNLRWICPSSKFHNSFSIMKRLSCECEHGGNFHKGFLVRILHHPVYKIHMHGHLRNCMHLRLKDKTDEMLEQFESECADLASWQNWIANEWKLWHDRFSQLCRKRYLTWFPLNLQSILHGSLRISNLLLGAQVKATRLIRAQAKAVANELKKEAAEEWAPSVLGWIWHLAFFKMRPWWTQNESNFDFWQ